MKTALNYIFQDVFRTGVTVEETKPKELGLKLPVLMQRQYQFFIGGDHRLDEAILFVQPKEQPPIRLLEQHYQTIKKQYSGPVLFYFDRLGTRERQRLVHRKIQFIVADRFLFAPELGILGPTPTFTMRWEDLIETKDLSPLAENILIGQLLDGRYEGQTGKAIAEQLDVTAAAVSQALAELEKHRLVQLIRDGRAKLTHFKDRAALWHESLDFLDNPVEAEIQLKDWIGPTVKAGLSALAETTMLADSDILTLAAYKRNFKKALEEQTVSDEPAEGEKFLLQFWRRDPLVYMEEGRVDPISLYLTLQTSEDERVQKELDNLLKEIGLEAQ